MAGIKMESSNMFIFQASADPAIMPDNDKGRVLGLDALSQMFMLLILARLNQEDPLRYSK